MGHWDIGTFGYWHIGRLKHWDTGTLGALEVGTLGHFDIVRLVGWDIGKMENWDIGKLGHWGAGGLAPDSSKTDSTTSSYESFQFELTSFANTPATTDRHIRVFTRTNAPFQTCSCLRFLEDIYVGISDSIILHMIYIYIYLYICVCVCFGCVSGVRN